MTDPSKVQLTHTQRAAFVYIRQSTPGQVEHNRESTARQYALADRACQLGWPKERVVIIDEDLGLSGSSTDKRSGFARLTSEVALAHVGIVLGLEVSRLARNNADWYRLLELCGITDTLIGDSDGVYHPALFNDRLLLGLKGTMSEAELHIIRARLDGGIRNKAARGELRRGLPVGFIWGEQDGEVLFHPDEAVTGAIRTVFERFAEFGSARRVWLWFRSEGLSLPLQQSPAGQPGPIRWVAPTYTAIHHILTNPVYAGAYTYGGLAIEQAVANAFLEAVTPAAVEAMRLTVEQLQTNHDAALSQWRLEVERTRYEAEKAARRYRAVEPENRLVARGLETEWESRLRDLSAAEAELRRREQQRPGRLAPEQLQRLQTLGSDIRQVWDAATTTDRDRKELLRTLLEEVVLNLKRAEGRAHLTLRWRGGAITILDVPVPRFRPMGPRTDEDTISLLPRLAALYPDEVIAGILNRQGRKTATGERFTANQVGSLRRYRNIPRFQPPAEPPSGELVSIRKAAQILGMNTSSIHRWLADGFIAGEQVTPGAPWQIRITAELRARIVQEAPPEYLPMLETTLKLGVSRQTVLQRVKRGELEAVLVRQGRRKGLRIKVIDQMPDLFEELS
jgi:DNA invertase Pin-like site-specific DNA recombinase